jgi:hypothetical protein
MVAQKAYHQISAGKIEEIGGFVPSFIKLLNNFACDSSML